MKIQIRRVAKGRERWAEQASQSYLQRLRNFSTEEQTLRLSQHRDLDRKRSDEAQRTLYGIGNEERLVALDERGALLTTEELRDWIQECIDFRCKRLIFAIGGPFGHAQIVRDQSWRTLALSPLVLNHELARVVLAEQLYRVHTLIWGGSYHH